MNKRAGQQPSCRSSLRSDASQVIFRRRSGEEEKMGPRSDLAKIAEGCQNCKIPVKSIALSLEPLNCNSFEKSFCLDCPICRFRGRRFVLSL